MAKRGRPPKKKTSNKKKEKGTPAPSQPKKRGRPPKAKSNTAQPKKRGRPPKNKKDTHKNKGGRPRRFSRELAKKICDRIANGMSLSKTCKIEGMPSRATVMGWLCGDNLNKNDYEWFAISYARARERQYEGWADEIVDITDNEGKDEFIDEHGKKRGNHAKVQRDRLRVDARKWLLSKLMPKQYGDKIDVTSKGEKIDGINYIMPPDPNKSDTSK